MICSNCGANLPEDSKFCTACGRLLAVSDQLREDLVASTAARVCASCGALLDDDDLFCPFCGKKQGENQIENEALSHKPIMLNGINNMFPGLVSYNQGTAKAGAIAQRCFLSFFNDGFEVYPLLKKDLLFTRGDQLEYEKKIRGRIPEKIIRYRDVLRINKVDRGFWAGVAIEFHMCDEKIYCLSGSKLTVEDLEPMLRDGMKRSGR